MPSRLVPLVASVALLGAGCALTPSDPSTAGRALFQSPVENDARAALVPSATVTVDGSQELTLKPSNEQPRAGLVFYPGAYVDPRAYAVPARLLAERGFLVVLPRMPFGIGLLNSTVADGVMARHPEVTAWAVGGHSLGGVVAAGYAGQHPTIRGLLLCASYPASSNDLSQSHLRVTSLYGSLDGLAKPAVVLESARLLPSDTRFVRLEGGNHAQFGSYGPQSGDNPATLARAEQHRLIAEATAELMEAIASASATP